MHDLRIWRTLIEATMRLDPRYPIYHGTSDIAWQEIERSNAMTDDEQAPSGFISFTMSVRVAEEFARFACQRHDTETGVVIKFDTGKLMQDFVLEPYVDPTLSKEWQISDEQEVRIQTRRLLNVKDYIIGTYTVSRDSSDDPSMWGPGAETWKS